MKIKVLNSFRDKSTLRIHKKGDSLELPKDRAEAAIKRGLAENIEKKEGKPKTEKKEK